MTEHDKEQIQLLQDRLQIDRHADSAVLVDGRLKPGLQHLQVAQWLMDQNDQQTVAIIRSTRPTLPHDLWFKSQRRSQERYYALTELWVRQGSHQRMSFPESALVNLARKLLVIPCETTSFPDPAQLLPLQGHRS